MNQDIMERMLISSMFKEFRKSAIVKGSTLLKNLDRLSSKIQASDFIVVDEENKYKGTISLRKNRLTDEYENLVDNLITIDDVAELTPTVRPQESLGKALKYIVDYDVDKVAVLDSDDSVLGYLRYIDLFRMYHEEIKNHSRIKE